jgi:hypothetical protein
VFKTGWLEEHLGLKERKYREAEENYTMKRLVTFTLHQILFG